ncbi:MAG: FtsK/SpoIIIE domain-containing protein, partial [Planctomycetota bacterium]
LLQTMVGSLVARYAPDELQLLLFDFKGGATFAGMENLASVMGIVTDLSAAELERALGFLDAELQARKARFKEASTADGGYVRSYERYRSEFPNEVLPRIVVVFEEFAALVGEFDSAHTTAIRLAQQGRALGMHVIMATQRPSASVINVDVQANVGTRIALRTVSTEESHLILGHPNAAAVPRTVPGRAIVSLGGNQLIGFQAGFGGHVADESERQAVVIRPLSATRRARRARSVEERSGLSDFETLLAAAPALPEANDDELIRTHDRKIPRLDPSFDGREVGRPRGTATDGGPAEITVGVCDNLERRERELQTVDLGAGPAVVAGGIDTGKSGFLLANAEHLRTSLGDAVELVAIDNSSDDLREAAGELFDWIVPSGDKRELALLAEQLEAELRARQDPGWPRRPVFVFIDDIQQLYELYAYGHDDAAMIATWADLIRRGRRLGIHVLATAPTLQFGSATLRGAFRHRFQLRPRPDDLDLVPEAAALPTGVALDERGRQVKFFAPARRRLPAPRGPRRFGRLPQPFELAPSGAPDGVALLGVGEVDRMAVEVGARPGLPLLVAGEDEAKRLAAVRWITDEFNRAGTPAL